MQTLISVRDDFATAPKRRRFLRISDYGSVGDDSPFVNERRDFACSVFSRTGQVFQLTGARDFAENLPVRREDWRGRPQFQDNSSPQRP